MKLLKSQIGRFLYESGINYFDYGTVKKQGKKVYDYFKIAPITPDQEAAILRKIPRAAFGMAQSQFAPEQRKRVLLIPVGRM